MQQGNGLTHHVRSHQGTVSIVVLQEGNQRSGNRSYLLGRNVHQVDFSRGNDREIGVLTALDHLTDKGAIGIERGITLTDDVFSLFFCG